MWSEEAVTVDESESKVCSDTRISQFLVYQWRCKAQLYLSTRPVSRLELLHNRRRTSKRERQLEGKSAYDFEAKHTVLEKCILSNHQLSYVLSKPPKSLSMPCSQSIRLGKEGQ